MRKKIIEYPTDEIGRIKSSHLNWLGVKKRKNIVIAFEVFKVSDEATGIYLSFHKKDGTDGYRYELGRCIDLEEIGMSNYAISTDFFNNSLKSAREGFKKAIETFLNENATLIFSVDPIDSYEGIAMEITVGKYQETAYIPIDDEIKKFLNIKSLFADE